MYFPNAIEDICYKNDHIINVENKLKEGFLKYFIKFIETENGNTINQEKFNELSSKFNIKNSSNKKNYQNINPKILKRIINEEIEKYEKDRGKYLEFLNLEYLEEYIDDASDFKNTVLKNECPIIRHTIQNKKAKELDKYRYDFTISNPNNLLEVVSNIVTFAEDYKNKKFSHKDFYNISSINDLELDILFGNESYLAKGVIGAGIRSHFLYKLYPYIFPNRSRDAIWALWYLTDKEKFGCIEDSEFLMIKIEENTTQQNFFYPYDLFTYYSIKILQFIENEFSKCKISIPTEQCFVIVDSFLSFVANEHSDEINFLSRKELDYVSY
jgi:hypothetical protein